MKLLHRHIAFYHTINCQDNRGRGHLWGLRFAHIATPRCPLTGWGNRRRYWHLLFLGIDKTLMLIPGFVPIVPAIIINHWVGIIFTGTMHKPDGFSVQPKGRIFYGIIN